MNKHIYAHQVLNGFGISINTPDGQPISKTLTKEDRFLDFELKTSYTLGKHISISNKKVIQLGDYGDILKLGFQISKRRAPGKFWTGSRVEYFLVKQNRNYFDMGLIPPQHIVEYNTEENWLRLVGRNSNPNKVFVYLKRGHYKKELRLQDMVSFYEEEILRVSPFTFQEAAHKKTITEIPLLRTDDGKIVCLPERRDLPKIGIFGKNGTGKTLIEHMLLDCIYNKWKKRCFVANDSVSFQTKSWSLPWNFEQLKELSKLYNVETLLKDIGHKTKPLPLFYLFPNTDDLNLVELENDASFKIALPYKDILSISNQSFFEDIEDLGKSGKYMYDLIYNNEGKPRSDGLLYAKTIQEIKEIVDEQVFEEREIIGANGMISKQRAYIYKISSDGTRGKIFSLLKEVFNSQIFDVRTGVNSKWLVEKPDGSREAMYPWKACLLADIIPVLVTQNLRYKKFFPAYFKFIMNDLFKMQTEDPLVRRNEEELWIFIDEFQNLAQHPILLQNITEIAKEARPNRIGMVYATQFFGQIQGDLELITDYIISFQQTKEMGSKILENFDGMKSLTKQIRTLPKFHAIVAAKSGESLVVYDTEGKREIIDDGTPFKGMVFPPVSQHSAPKREGI